MIVIEKIPTLTISREDWLRERRNSIGGSDVGAILGLNKYRSPYAVWAEKTGRLPEPEDNEAMRQGRDLEAYVAGRFMEKSGKRVERCNYLLRNTDAPYLHANIDRRVIGEKSGLECKTASALNLRAYKGGNFPESYYAQCVSYLAVTSWKRWYLAALILNKAFYIYQITTIENDDVPEWCESSVYVGPEELTALKECASNFWENYVVADIPPPVDGSESTSQTISAMYGKSFGSTVELFARENILLEWAALHQQAREIQTRQRQIKQILMNDLGQAETGICGDWRIVWKEQKRCVVSIEKLHRVYPRIDIGKVATCKTFRRFRIQKGALDGTD